MLVPQALLSRWTTRKVLASVQVLAAKERRLRARANPHSFHSLTLSTFESSTPQTS